MAYQYPNDPFNGQIAYFNNPQAMSINEIETTIVGLCGYMGLEQFGNRESVVINIVQYFQAYCALTGGGNSSDPFYGLVAAVGPNDLNDLLTEDELWENICEYVVKIITECADGQPLNIYDVAAIVEHYQAIRLLRQIAYNNSP